MTRTGARYSWPRENALRVQDWEFAHSPLEADGVAPTLATGAAESWHRAQAPGSMVQWECYLAGIGENSENGAPGHPYIGANSVDYRWTAQATWWYRTRITAGELESDAARAELVFDGVDHDAWVWVDGVLVSDHQGMFGGPVLDVSAWLDDRADHEVVVGLRPVGAGQGKEIGWGTKGRVIKPETFCRWVNNPDLMTCGIWQPVRLVQTGRYRLERPRVTSALAADGSARLRAEVEVLRADVTADLHWVQRHGEVPPVWDSRYLEADAWSAVDAPDAVDAEVVVTVRDPDGAIVAEAPIALDAAPGRVWADVEITIDEPRLWWPNGLGPDGAAELYTVSFELSGPARDRLEVRTGLREIDWEASGGPRLADHWFGWQSRINSVAAPLRGMNWSPSDVLRQDRTRTRHLLQLMRDAGVQMVRVWGGGLVETDDFYDACDELGLLVWQDFPINTHYDCSEIPLDVWEQQVVWIIERLRNRASLAVWCGGNEFDPYAPENAAVVGIAERTITDLDGTRPFVRSCSDPGDVHPYLECDTTWYLPMYRQVPSISEWGGHTLPTRATLSEILPADELERPLDSLLSSDPDAFGSSHPALRHHWAEFQPDRVPRMLNRARIFDDLSQATFDQALEAIQLGAAEIYQTIITDFSAGDTECRLLMPWVYNRAWPSVGMQAVDHSGHPTLGYYAIRRGYARDAIVIRPAHEALAPGEALRFAAGRVRGATSRDMTVAVYDQSLRELFRDRVEQSAGAGSLQTVTVDLPDGTDAAIIVATDDADSGVQHVRVIRVSASLSDPAERSAYRASPQTTAHFMAGSLRAAAEGTPTTLSWSVDEAEAIDVDATVLVVTVENTGDAPAAFVSIDSADPLRVLVPEDNGFWIEPRATRRIAVSVRAAADVSGVVTDRPAAPVAEAVSLRWWNR